MRRFVRFTQFVAILLFCLLISACGAQSTPTENDVQSTDASQSTDDSADDSADDSTDDSADDSADTTDATNELKQGELNVAWNGEVPHWDPYDSPTVHTYSTGYLLYDTLIEQNLEGKFVPMLSTEWSANDDYTEWTFALRDDVKFSNGEQFNAECVKTSFERLINETLAKSPEWESLTEVVVEDDYTVKLVFSDSNGGVLFNAALLPMLPAKYFAEVGTEGISKDPIGSGPFVLSEWDQGQKMVFARRDDYWNQDDISDFKDITFFVMSEGTTRIAALQTGDCNFAYVITPDQYALIEGDEGFQRYDEDGYMDTTFFGLKCDEPPFDNVKARQALSLAIDRAAVVEYIVGSGKPAVSCLPKGCLGYEDSIAYPARDVAKATQLLEESGYDGEELTLICPIGWYPKMQEQAEAFIAQLGEAGFNFRLEMLEPAGYLEKRNDTGEYNLFYTAMSQPQGYPNTFLTQRVENDANSSGYVNEELNNLIATARNTGDLDELQDLYSQANKIMTELCAPQVWLYQYAPYDIASAEIEFTPEAMRLDRIFSYADLKLAE